MRSLLIASLVTVAAAYRDWKFVDTKWATHPDRTADWYKDHGTGRVPEVAPTVTTVDAYKSSIVKLECVGCPFRVRRLHLQPESWQEPPQENSMLLNFTIDDSSPALLLNGRPIAPLAPMPLSISTFQVHANFSKAHMNKAVRLQLLDDSWNLGTKFGRFQLQYEHTVVGTPEPGKIWIQFDITGIIYPSDKNGHYELRGEGQKLVQILLREGATPHELFMEEVQVVDRKDRAQPYVMKCGRLAMTQTAFNPLEWDYYGKIGSWSRMFNLLVAQIWHNLPFLIIFAILVPVVAFVRWLSRKKKAVALVEDDAEAALLNGEHGDATSTDEAASLTVNEEKA